RFFDFIQFEGLDDGFDLFHFNTSPYTTSSTLPLAQEESTSAGHNCPKLFNYHARIDSRVESLICVGALL
ncbi:hypothetical protein, partial [Parasphingorhabdus sp.]|uniref:hypothetical protein n=1 Tax=Parasphingorhabdus sp. TaxID=2709688 RepID=UPI0030024237